MAVESARERARANPRAVTAVVSVVGYAVVLSAFAGLIPFPTLTKEAVVLFSDLIAVINTAALTSLLVGWWLIKQNRIRHHRAAMLTAFVLIVVFLVLYIWKQSGGFTKEFVVPAGAPLAAYAGAVTVVYTAMLAIHVLLSIVAVPVVVHAVVLGLTHSVEELPRTSHPTVGRIAVWSWSVSLALGILTYLLLNHVYDWQVLRGATAALPA